MLYLLSLLVFGLIIGLIAKAIHPGEDPIGFLPTCGIRIAGSYIGGFINFLLGKAELFSMSGMVMSILGGVIFCWIYRKYRLDRLLEMQKAEMVNRWKPPTNDE
jgi:uncharacterized membrane protein YeaQ/YmgE (transglycosylase-associated protein family)